MDNCTIAELGFGTGLNFLETIRQWRARKRTNANLHFISFEQFPLDQQAIEKALSQWPELKDLTEKLLNIWNLERQLPEDKLIDVEFAEDIRLTIYFEDANAKLAKLNFRADAWFLDGFSPAKNPELWNEELMTEVHDHAVAGGTFATYTAAGFVKRGLQAAGFDVQKVKGFAKKREMLVGRKPKSPEFGN